MHVVLCPLSLSHMLDAHGVDVALITEHKLLTRSESFFTSIHSNYKTVWFVYRPVQFNQMWEPPLWLREMHIIFFQQVVNISNERICGIQMQTRHGLPLFILCVYMTAHHDLLQYRETLSDIQDLVATYSQQGTIIIAGDFNTSKTPSDQTRTSTFRICAQ